jgi:uncharacterized protein (TIGR02246 family)
MQTRRSLVLAGLLVLAGCATQPPGAGEGEVIAAAEAWKAAYDSRDPARIAGMYAKDATFWGTTMKVIATDPAAVFTYFKDAGARPNGRVRFDSHNVRVLGDVATDSGAYTFTDQRDGAAVVNPSRFTMVFQRRDGKWVLVHHHSSRVP